MATKARSPNYPGISFQRALDFARKLYDENHLHKASSEVVAKAMGYGSLNGGSLTAIAALKKYGLIEEDNKEWRITKDALTVIVEPTSSKERARTIAKLGTKPELFAELQQVYPGKVPSDEILRSWFLRKGFVASTVDMPIRAYRDTMELVEAQKTFYEAGIEEALALPLVTGVPSKETTLVQAAPQAPPLAPSTIESAPPPPTGAPAGMKQDIFTFAQSDGHVVFQWPATMTKEEFEDLEAWLVIKLRGIKRTIQ